MAVWDDMRVQPHVRAAAKEISEKFGITNIGGFATSGHIPDSDHYKGLAIDVMTTIKGKEISDWVIANAARLGVKYIIWNRHIWQNGKWTNYTGTSPHTDHVHISFNATPGTGGTTVDSGTSTTDSGPVGCLQHLIDLFNPLA